MKKPNPIPTADQIGHVRDFLSWGIVGHAAVARLTDVPLRAVFRIAATMPKQTGPQL